jgi:3-oxoacyl-[acyl-carrier protein] reductase
MPEEVKNRFLSQIPLGRFGDVSDIVDAALFLCSPAARYITGQILHVNGGFYM